MNRLASVTKPRLRYMALLLASLAAGCGGGGGGQDPILGAGNVVLAPTVIAIAPLPNAIAVPVNTKIIAAAFSKAMDQATLTPANFTLACGAAGTAGVVGTPLTLVAGGAVSYVTAGNTATLTLAGTLPADDLPATADCTATVTTGTKDTTGIPLSSNFSWIFTTGIARDLTRPRVTLTAPATSIPGPTAVPIGTAVTATFSKPMNPATIVAPGAFTLTCALPCVSPPASPAGAGNYVTYDLVSQTATYTPPATLAPSTIYTATIKGIGALAVTDTVAAVPGPGANALAGNTVPLAGPSDYVWTFTTGLTPDTTRPRVLSTFPATGAIVAPATIPNPTLGVPTNTAITATFTEDMLPLIGANFTLTCAAPCVSPAGTVSYVGRTMTFTPSAPPLDASTTYTATIKGTGASPAKDLAIPANALAGNQAALPAASDYIWRFTTAAAPVLPGNISVSSTNTTCPNAVNATFTVPSGLGMNALTITAGANFTVTGPAPALDVIPGTMTFNAAPITLATFTPTTALTPGSNYTLTITGGATGVKDLAVPVANTLNINPFVLVFTPGPATGACVAPARLAAAAPFGTYGGSAGMTNQGINSIINGDIGTIAASTLVTGFHDNLVAYTSPLVLAPAGAGCTYTETTLNIGVINGLIYTAAPPPTVACPNEGTAATKVIADAAALDAWNEFNALATLPAGLDVSTCPGCGGIGAGALELGGRTLAPGTYDSASTYAITFGDLTLDAGGNANAVWIFRMGTSLTVGNGLVPSNVILTNGAQAKNVFWVVGTGTNGPGRVIDGGAGAATINGISGGGTMVGTIISTAGVTFSTPGVVAITTLNGRALSVKGPLIGGVPSSGASVTMVNTVINVPAP